MLAAGSARARTAWAAAGATVAAAAAATAHLAHLSGDGQTGGAGTARANSALVPVCWRSDATAAATKAQPASADAGASEPSVRPDAYLRPNPLQDTLRRWQEGLVGGWRETACEPAQPAPGTGAGTSKDSVLRGNDNNMCRGSEGGNARQRANGGVSPGGFERLPTELPRWAGPARRSGEPEYTRAQVSAMDGADGRPVWVTYRNGVYDVTAFRSEHPGGEFLSQAAGGPVDAFWQVWAFHHLSEKVPAFLDRLRVGALSDWSSSDDCVDDGGQYASEPLHRRGAGQVELLKQPWASETAPSALAAGYLTANDDFYVRNHAPVPVVEANSGVGAVHAEWVVSVGHNNGPRSQLASEQAAVELPLALLCALFPPVTVTSVVQCTGNRAADNIAANPGQLNGFVGTPFENIGVGMCGNAQWRGPRLRDVLLALVPGLKAVDGGDGGSRLDGLHVELEGADGYVASVPLSVALDPHGDCLLATEMNGEPLPPDHGFPVRAVLPGVVGARNVKWLTSLRVRRGESDSPWHAHYYKVGPIGCKASAVLLPIQSLTLVPEPGDTAPAAGEPFVARGVAYSGGTGRRIASVEVSADGGATWVDAVLRHDEAPSDDSAMSHGWVRWAAELTAPVDGGAVSVVCRARDDAGESQPEVGDCNGGYLYNGWHRVVLPRADAEVGVGVGVVKAVVEASESASKFKHE